MTAGPPPAPRSASDEAEARYHEAAGALADGLERVVADWIVREVTGRIPDDWPPERRAELEPTVREVASRIHDRVVPALRRLLGTDVDAQAANPLGLLRAAVGPANELLARAGVPAPPRDPVTESMFPDDPYGLGPANFADVDERLHEPGLVWGAAKAHVVLLRHRH